MIAQTIREALRVCVFISVLIPALTLAVVADPSQLLTGQLTRLSALAVAGSAQQEEMVTQLMVKPRHQVGDQLKTELRARDAGRLTKISNVSMSVVREMSGDTHVIRLDQPVTLSEARVIAARLMRDNSVELAEPDRRKHPLGITPTDPNYAGYQWNLQTISSSNLGSANLPNAWSISEGSNTITVAVLDTGYRPHADFGSVILPGYDFITDIPTANDGNGRDSDAQDPGDWITVAENASGQFQGCGVSNSSWHGTHVTGIIVAQMNNGIGITGIAPNIRILPVRVLGKCGGYDSDIIDGMRWAAGIAVAGVSSNLHRAQVLNMSLGGTGACSTAFQSAVTDVIAAGTTIVAASGNDGTSTLSMPANCIGVIAVTAHTVDGDNAWYATIGAGTTISAPGGGCGRFGYPGSCTTPNSVGVYSLWNTGLTVPVSDSYTYYEGTSMATPHVAAVAALMLSINPSLTPVQIKSYLQSSARPFPSSTICTEAANVGLCGAGMLDAYQALNAVGTSIAPLVTLGNIPSVVSPGSLVTLSGSATASSPWSIATYTWTQLTGTAVALNNPTSPTATFTAPSTGTFSFKLTATDNNGQSGTVTVVIAVNSPPILNAVSALTVTAGQTLNFTVTATDPDGNLPIIFHSVTLPAGATLSATGNFSWPNASPAGNYSLVYYASDTYNANSVLGTVNITVTAASGGGGGSSGGGGGGSFNTETLAVLSLLAAGLRLRRRFTNPLK